MSERRWLEGEAQLHARAKVALLEAFPETDPEDEFFVGSMEGASDFYDMLDLLVTKMHEAEAEAVGLRAQADAYALPLYDRAAARDQKAARIKDRLLNVLTNIGEKKVPRPAYDLTVRHSGNPPVTLINRDQLPPHYWRQKPAPDPEPDLKAIKDALKDPQRSKELAGIAALGNDKPSLIIKRK